MVDARHWLALARTPGGRATLGALLDELGTPEAIFTAAPARLRAAQLPEDALRWIGAPDWARVDADLRWVAERDIELVPRGHAAYPPLLAASPDAPLLLFVRGQLATLAAPQLAIVGSRNPTPHGRRDAQAFAEHLAGAGLAIVSGLALGIDAAAHEGALAAGGITLAVCATGLDRVYPTQHRELAARIAERGSLVSEFVPGTPPLQHNFPLRNRIIAGLSIGTLVVEAAQRSGSLITARLASEAGREVFAIPGSIHNPLAKGCHRLIRDGAKLVETAQDVLEELGALAGVALRDTVRAEAEPTPRATDDDAESARVLEEVDWSPTAIDRIVERTGFSIAVVSSALLMLELQGRVAASAGGRYTRLNSREGQR